MNTLLDLIYKAWPMEMEASAETSSVITSYAFIEVMLRPSLDISLVNHI